MIRGWNFLVGDEKGNVVAMNLQVRDVLPSKDGAAFDTEILEAALGKRLSAIMDEMRRAHVDRIDREVEIAGKPYRLIASRMPEVQEEGAAIAIVLHDLSAHRESDAKKTEFISLVSHELLTPLTSVRNAISTILKGKAGSVSPEQERFLSLAERNVDRLAATVTDLSDFSKLEAGKLDVEYGGMELDATVNGVISSFESQAEENSLLIHAKIATGIPSIQGDQKRIEQILRNLIGNAIKFTDPGGQIWVTARVIPRSELATFRAVTKRQEDLLEVTVKDTGIGIPAEALEAVFDRFYQVGNRRRHDRGGMGLGLSIVKKLVEAHQGRVWVESEVGRGSTFTFVLPLIKEDRRDTEFRRLFNRMFDQARHGESVLSLIMIRINNYKDIVSVFGDMVGQRVLDAARESIDKLLYRPSDSAVRYRNEDMVIVLVDANKDGSVVVRNRIEEALIGLTFREAGESVELEWKMGMATYPDDASNERELYRKARENLERSL
jgi:diguanylate cyclase (GGDEF)-like protein